MDRKITALFLTPKWPSLNYQLSLQFLAQTLVLLYLQGRRILFCCTGSCKNLFFNV